MQSLLHFDAKISSIGFSKNFTKKSKLHPVISEVLNICTIFNLQEQISLQLHITFIQGVGFQISEKLHV